ncbi:MAG: hypothetical protein A2020_09310 [Lentisphaerae bacterium GWF2_45_14]|nr:MAG: hypothetical protein A2020_09310 [Lentisphaerae bacterium GWF2_45_14]
MMLFAGKDISAFDMGDEAQLAALDSAGLIPAPGEGPEEFRSRLLEMEERYRSVEKQLQEKGEFDLCGEFILKKEDRIGADILSEAAGQTSALYGFSIDWVPGFFLTGETIPLWGGCAVFLPSEKITLFMIRASFRENKRWFIYSRDELLSHELCHVARMPVGDRIFDEFFAYRTAKSAFRRYAGSCFRGKWDSILFILPVFVLLIARILETFFSLPVPMLPFWVLAGLYPGFLFCRNYLARHHYFKAKRNLEKTGITEAQSILFRCTSFEIIEISRAGADNKIREFVEKRLAEGELRWKVIDYRFIRTVGEETERGENGKS